MPGQATSIPIDPNPQPMFVANRRHRGPECSASAVGKPEQNIGVILDRSARHDLAHFCRHFRDFKAGHKSRELVCVRPQVE